MKTLLTPWRVMAWTATLAAIPALVMAQPMTVQSNGAMRLDATDPSVALVDTDVTAGQGDGLRTEFVSGLTPFLKLPGTGLFTYQNLANDRGFGTKRLISACLNNWDQTATSAGFPNNLKPSGDDGYCYFWNNRTVITSTQNLRAGRPQYTPTISSGVITALTLDTSHRTNGYANGEQITVFADSTTGGTGLVATATANASGVLPSTATVTSGGSGYSGASTIVVGEPPASTQILDAGPTFELNRDVAADAGSILGALHFGGRSAGASGVDTYYASIVAGVENPSTQAGRLYFATGGAYSASAGVQTRFEISANGLRAIEAPLLGSGAISASGYLGVHKAAGGGAILVNSDSSTQYSSIGELQFYAKDAGGGHDFYGRMRGTIMDSTAGSEDGRIDFRTAVAGADGSRIYIGAGLFTDESGVTDPGTGNIAANHVVAKTGFNIGTGQPATSQVSWAAGSGSPEGVRTCPIGCLWSRTDGGAGTTLYVKQSGTGNTGWAAK